MTYIYSKISLRDINFKYNTMDDDCTYKNLEKDIFRKSFGKIFNVGHVFQSIWIRCRPILSYYSNREYLIRQFNFVLYFGSILWIILLFSKII